MSPDVPDLSAELPEGASFLARLEHVRDRLKIGYHAKAPEDLQWLIGEAYRLMARAAQTDVWKAAEAKARERNYDLERSNGRLLAQVDRLRLELEGLRESEEARA